MIMSHLVFRFVIVITVAYSLIYLLISCYASLKIMKVIMILRMLIMISSMHGYSLLTGMPYLMLTVCLLMNYGISL
jgi:hypothetical protein